MEYFLKLVNLILFPGFIFTIIMGLLISGIDRKIVARMQRRRGPKIIQPFYDIVKLIGKDTIVPRNASSRLFTHGGNNDTLSEKAMEAQYPHLLVCHHRLWCSGSDSACLDEDF